MIGAADGIPMPREITILSPVDFGLTAVATASEGFGGAVEVREIDAGAALQVMAGDGAVLLTVYRPLLLKSAGEVARLLPDAPDVALPIWWSDAFSPFGSSGEAGVSIALRVALALDAVCVVAD